MRVMDYDQLEDAALVALVSNRDEAALAALYDRYSRLVYSVAYRIVNQHQLAEEIALDAFQSVWRAATSFSKERGRFVTWLMSVTRHRAIDELRRMGVRPEGSQVALDTGLSGKLVQEDSVEEIVSRGQRRADVRRALVDLPEAQRHALELAYFGGLTQREIAEQLDTPLGTIKTRMRMGMQKLRRALESRDDTN